MSEIAAVNNSAFAGSFLASSEYRGGIQDWDFRRGQIGSWFQWQHLKDMTLVWSMAGLKENTWGWRECLNMERFPSIQYNKDNAWFCVYLNTTAQKQWFLFIYKEYFWPKALKFKKIMKLFHVKNPCIVFSLSFFSFCSLSRLMLSQFRCP